MKWGQQVRALSAIIVVAAVLTTTACVAAHKEASPSFTVIPTEPAPVQTGAPTPVGSFSDFIGTYAFYEVTQFHAAHGCGCTTIKGGKETYPAGSTVILLKVTLTPQSQIWQQGTTWTVPDLAMTATDGWQVAGKNGSELPLANVDGKARAAKARLSWLPAGLFPGGVGTVTNGVPASFAIAYYLPAGTTQITAHVTGYEDPTQGNNGVVAPADVQLQFPHLALTK